MKQSATIVRRSAAGPNRRTHTLTLPPDLLQKVGSRVKLVAILLMIGFVVDPAIQLVVWVTSQMTGGAGPSSLSDFRRKSFVFNDSPFQLETVNTVI